MSLYITHKGVTTRYTPPAQLRDRQRTNRTATSQPSAATLNQQDPISEVQKNKPAGARPIPIVYGNAQVGGLPFSIDYSNDKWTVGYVVALGEIESFVNVWINDEAPPAGVTINYYTGTPSQTADPLLAAAITDYADALVLSKPSGNVGIAYIVLQYAGDVYDDWPRVVVEVEGKKVYNPKTGLVEYSENPALHLADLISSVDYGNGYAVDATALEAAQDYCDDATLGEPRRRSFLVVDKARETAEWVDIARSLASCFVVVRGDTVYLVPDKTETPVATFTAQNIIEDSMRIEKKDSANLPTVVRVQYTDTTGNEWRERYSEPAQLPGVTLGTVDRRESRVRMTGVNRHSQAYREAMERLNKLQLSDLVVNFQTFDYGLYLEVGDVIDVTHPYGLTNKLCRIDREPVQVSPGRWSVSAVEYDPAAYSNEIATQPSYTDGSLPSGAVPAAVEGLTLGEVTYQTKNGEYLSRITASWSPSADIFTTGYLLTVKDDTNAVVYTTNTGDTEAATPPLKELVQYTVTVRAVTPTSTGDPASANYTIIGKTAIPDAPATLTGFEAGGEVRLKWSASTDVDAKRYEVRYSDTTGSWDTAEVIDVVDGLRLTSREIPPSENATGAVWRFYVKTIDSVFQYSDTAATLDISVTQDNDAFSAGTVSPITTHDSLTFMHQSDEARDGSALAYYADGNDTWTSLFGAAAMNTFTNPLASYQTAQGTAEFYSEELALLEDRAGNWLATPPTVVDFTGTSTTEFGLKPDAGSYSWGAFTRREEARYSQIRVTGAGLFKVTLPSGSMRADVIADEETGSDTSLASGGKTITLTNPYAEVRSIVITPQGTASRVAVFDNVVVGATASFDVYIFDAAGTQVANDFQWSWKGV